MEAHRENPVQRESSESIQSIDCLCNTFAHLGLTSVKTKSWNSMCSVHGVGTDYFKTMSPKPYGYGSEQNTSRSQWLEYNRALIRNGDK